LKYFHISICDIVKSNLIKLIIIIRIIKYKKYTKIAFEILENLFQLGVSYMFTNK